MALVSFDTAHRGPIHDAQLDYYGKVLATASSDGTIRLWNVSSDPPQFLSELRGHDGPVWQVTKATASAVKRSRRASCLSFSGCVVTPQV